MTNKKSIIHLHTYKSHYSNSIPVKLFKENCYENHIIAVPRKVVGELNGLKKNIDEKTAYAARTALKILGE